MPDTIHAQVNVLETTRTLLLAAFLMCFVVACGGNTGSAVESGETTDAAASHSIDAALATVVYHQDSGETTLKWKEDFVMGGDAVRAETIIQAEVIFADKFAR